MYKEDSALNNLQWLICHKTKSTNQTPQPGFEFGLLIPFPTMIQNYHPHKAQTYKSKNS